MTNEEQMEEFAALLASQTMRGVETPIFVAHALLIAAALCKANGGNLKDILGLMKDAWDSTGNIEVVELPRPHSTDSKN